ncbi:aminotransferase class I/II-fold pyridoxal phosphate-dependent enzyme [Methylobrevis pamukkalensis]|uniref:LL-diaminopimelate aminotransferase n=1 Tax=Methylobrevis pamukkalensis TaxID=1439726 RepID=A0A1E3GXD2_9HYPH|nr:aminotransferase class I/II-fold pyridoxal phosphate-dependent enzyme [Methylobrevis pamukkalensis]ODN68718.1 LL-diaminopimelate aminotransferase [Methylobrevis pamukkalensis]
MAAASPSLRSSPFQRAAALVEGLRPGADPIDLTIGEPRQVVPDFVAATLATAIPGFGRYPPIRGTAEFRQTVADWLTRRYGLRQPVDAEQGVLPLSGSRDGLFSASIEAIAAGRARGIERPAVLIPNPFYAVYASGAEIAGAEAVMLPAGADTGYLPDIAGVDETILARTVAAYFASPANPQGAVAGLELWQSLIGLARRHDFLLFADECYSEIWRGAPPPGALEAADALGAGYDRVVAFNSLSKRSGLPGLRCGFAAGDPAFLSRWAGSRNIHAPQVPLPLQAVAVSALRDEDHVADNRRLYDAKFEAAEAILGGLDLGASVLRPPGGFFLWLDVTAHGGGEAVTKRLYEEAGVRVLPGAYLSADDAVHGNPGANHIRIAMVEDQARTEEALRRIAGVLARRNR